jgi:SAM-dependent methyltransferase
MKGISAILNSWLLKEQFKPSFLGLFLNPFYFARKAIYKNIKFYSDYVKGITLDIGCGSKPYVDLFSTVQYIGIDLEKSGHNHSNSPVDIYYDGTKIPFGNEYFDSVVCFEVLEHVFNPDEFLKEANRVLKKGGSAVFTVPFIWDEHEQPYDFARYSSFGLKHIFEKNGFSVVESRKYLSDLRILSLLTNAYIYKVIRKILPGRIAYLFILPLTSLNNILGSLLYILPHNKDLYYGNIFVLKK